jgi:hypothetical protein
MEHLLDKCVGMNQQFSSEMIGIKSLIRRVKRIDTFLDRRIFTTFAAMGNSTQGEGEKNSEKDASISNALVENFRGPI